MASRFIDVSHAVEHGMVTYKGFPAPVICDFLSHEASRERYAPGTEFHIGRIDMIASTGTYIDSPFHRYADGIDLSDLPLTSLADLPVRVLRHAEDAGEAIDVDEVAALGDVSACAVLVHTGWDRHWRTDQYFEHHPHLTGAAAQWLVEAGAALVGIDSLNIDGTRGGTRPVHSTLLANDIPIVEHLANLDDVPDVGGRCSAVPVKVKGMGTFPVRAYVTVDT
jgi:kynurenine formamidase